MSKGIEDLGNGLGIIYVTDPSSGEILNTYTNDPDGARKVKIDGVMASSVGGSRVATAIITIDAPTGVGQIDKVVINGVDAIDIAVPLAYTGATAAVTLAADIVSAINSYTTGVASQDFTAIRVVDKVYIFTDSAAGTTYNGITPALTNTGNFTYTVDQDFLGGSSTLQNYDEAIGYNFYLDADYGSTQCSGGGIAVVTSKANAVDITNYIVNVGFQGNIPQHSVSVRDGAITYTRKGSISILSLSGEGAADDILLSIISSEVATGDIIIIRSATNTITVTDATGNISLQTATYDVITAAGMMLIYNGADNTWYELNRSEMAVADLAISTAKIQLLAITTALINDLAVTEGKIAALAVSTAKIQLLAITTALINDLAVTEGKIAALAVSTAKIQLLAITTALLDDLAVTTAKIADANVTLAKLESKLLIDTRDAPVSFETSEQGDIKIRFPYACTVTGIYAAVTKALSGTDNATITPKNNAGTTMTNGVVTLTLSSAIGTGFTSAPTANNTFVIGDVMTLTGAKTTVGGKSLVTIELVRT